MNVPAKLAPFALPTVIEVPSHLPGGALYSTLDLTQAYQQLPVTSETAEVLTIKTIKGRYGVDRLSIVIATAPSIFYTVMESTLLAIAGASVYLDDVNICGATPDEPMCRLNQDLPPYIEKGRDKA